MERDRTKKFLKYRNSYRHEEGGLVRAPVASSKPGSPTEDVSMLINNPPAPKWMPFVDGIRQDLDRCQQKMRELVELHGKHLLQTFDTPSTLEQDIDILTRDITRAFQTNNAKLKKLGEKIPNMTAEDHKIRKNIRLQLVRQIQALSVEFRQDQKVYLQKLRGQAAKGDLLQLGTTNAQFSDQEEIEEEPFNVSFTQDQQQLVAFRQNRVQDQSKQIRQIVRSINELAEIMDDLAMLVHDQGSILERIDYNVEQTEHYVIEATTVLKQTYESVKKTKTKLCVMALVILIVLMLFILILKVSLFN